MHERAQPHPLEQGADVRVTPQAAQPQAVTRVGGHIRIEQHRPLEDGGHLAAQLDRRHAARHFHAEKPNAARGRRLEEVQQPQCGFAGAAGPHQRQPLALAHGQAGQRENRPPNVVPAQIAHLVGILAHSRLRPWRLSMARLAAKASASRITPRANASSNSPWRVSSMMAVVSTRVLPAMLPPTSITAPTSEMTAPKAATMAAPTPRRASRKTAQASCMDVAPSARACKRRSGSTLRTAVIVSPATSGKAMIVWAKTMALGVNSQCRLPIGPLRESS